jgi:hypothetical protein
MCCRQEKMNKYNDLSTFYNITKQNMYRWNIFSEIILQSKIRMWVLFSTTQSQHVLYIYRRSSSENRIFRRNYVVQRYSSYFIDHAAQFLSCLYCESFVFECSEL